MYKIRKTCQSLCERQVIFLKTFKIFVPIFMSLALLVGVTQPLITNSENIADKVFRLHILANSDSTEDQNLKLKLKDYILGSTVDLFTADNLEDNIEIANKNSDKLAELCKEFVERLGYDYDVKVSVVKEFFDTRVYDDFTLPAGMYNSLKIEIGEGKGHNWWCIIFPSVCLSACSQSMSDYLTEDEMEIIESGYSPKFKIIEIYEKYIKK